MTTTAHEDQFTAATQTIEPVRQPYDTVAIMRRNVAALEVALRQQTERAEAAEAELARLAQQKPVVMLNLSHDGSDFEMFYDLSDLKFNSMRMPLYAAPVPAVPAEWRKVMAELAADLQAACDAEHQHRDQYPSVMRKYNNDMEIVEKARALLQSAETPKPTITHYCSKCDDYSSPCGPDDCGSVEARHD